MIEKNIGNIERVFRLIAGIALGTWAVLRPDMNGIEWFIALVSIMLILNGVFSRCYLWYLFEINTCSENDKDCIDNKTSCV